MNLRSHLFDIVYMSYFPGMVAMPYMEFAQVLTTVLVSQTTMVGTAHNHVNASTESVVMVTLEMVGANVTAATLEIHVTPK